MPTPPVLKLYYKHFLRVNNRRRGPIPKQDLIDAGYRFVKISVRDYKAAHEWVKEHLPQGSWIRVWSSFCFANNEHMLQFKLMWGNTW